MVMMHAQKANIMANFVDLKFSQLAQPDQQIYQVWWQNMVLVNFVLVPFEGTINPDITQGLKLHLQDTK